LVTTTHSRPPSPSLHAKVSVIAGESFIQDLGMGF
jgi:hypothetical protein